MKNVKKQEKEPLMDIGCTYLMTLGEGKKGICIGFPDEPKRSKFMCDASDLCFGFCGTCNDLECKGRSL